MADNQLVSSNNRFSIIPESTYGTNPASGALEFFPDECNIPPGQNQILRKTLTRPSNVHAVKGNQSPMVNLVAPLYKTNTAFHAILNRIFKLGTTSGIDPYQHPYTLDYSTLPGSFTLERIIGGANSSPDAQQALGCVPTSLTLSAPQGEVPTISVEAMAKEITRATGPSTAPSGSVDKSIFQPGDQLLEANGLEIHNGTTAFYVKPIAFDITINTGIDTESYDLGSNLRNQIGRAGDLEVTGNLEFVVNTGETWSSKNLMEQIRSLTEMSMRWRYSTGTSGNTNYRHFDLQLGANGTGAGCIFGEEGILPEPDGTGKIVASVPFAVMDPEANITLDVHNEKNGSTVNV